MGPHYPFSLPPLPYGAGDLQPEIDEKTLHFHHDKHFAAYVDNLNKLLATCPACQDWTLEQLILASMALKCTLNWLLTDHSGEIKEDGA